MEEQFCFTIERPLREIAADLERQMIHIHARYPHIVYTMMIDPGNKLGVEDQITFGMQELKSKLIQQIINAEFKYSKE